MSAFATVAGKSFNGKFTAKIDFPIGYFYVAIAYADIESLQSLHTLFEKYLDHMLVKFEQNRMVRTVEDTELFDKKMVHNFWQRVDAIFKDVSVTETIVLCLTINVKIIIFQYSKYYGSPTRVTRLSVTLNMADPISLNEKRP